MRIGIDASRANTYNRTGTEWYSFFVIRELLAQNTEHTYVLYVKEPLVDDMKDFAEKAEIRILDWPPRFLWNQLRLSWEMLWHAPEALFVPAHTVPLIHPRKLATTIHDVGFERYPELYAHHPIGPQQGITRFFFSAFVRIFSLGKYHNNELDYHRFSVRLALLRARKIFTVSAFSQEEICHFFQTSKEGIQIVYNGLHPAYEKKYADEEVQVIRKKYQLPEKYLYFVGRWEKKKNISDMLLGFAAFSATHPEYTLVLIGKPGTGFSEAWQMIPEQAKQHIIQLQNIHDDLPLIVAGAQALLFPSNYEGFGLPVLEAMAQGVPVICTKAASLPEVAGDAAFYLSNTSPQSFVEALKEVLENTELRKKLRDLGYQRAKQFTWSTTGRQISEALGKM